ncbi:MoaD/ThiS family protein [Phaeodactylibacter luteus]|uniref:Molybdopterin synthase sulfur carrier subunit n=1 Tax=Phaeodactylibacter luteus TaxID=1564516 RepID=A0A5C6RLW1_9BACT|nr:MoaD/ThiS family protein [Phaeodactylibacter luteus]TXB63217.1 MoaD/ThiS family protein [Phaeodactylibacter luteus]
MEINILAFGIARDILGGSQIQMPLPEGSTVGELKAALCSKFPAFAQLASLSIALNTSYASDSDPIRPTDEVVIIPPVSGG